MYIYNPVWFETWLIMYLPGQETLLHRLTGYSVFWHSLS